MRVYHVATAGAAERGDWSESGKDFLDDLPVDVRRAELAAGIGVVLARRVLAPHESDVPAQLEVHRPSEGGRYRIARPVVGVTNGQTPLHHAVGAVEAAGITWADEAGLGRMPQPGMPA